MRKQITSLIFALLLFLVSSLGALAQVVVTYPASGSFTVPAGVTTIKVELWGGGGNGGGVTSSVSTRGAGGGGGGAYVLQNILVNGGEVYNFTIPAQITPTTGSGAAGPITTFTGPGGTFTAPGGGGGIGNNGAGGAAGVGTFNGGAGGAAASNSGAGGGGGGGNAGVGVAGPTGTGGLGNPNVAPYKGGAGGANRTSNGAGNAGVAPGGGGGGGRAGLLSTNIGGKGAAGQVVITYTLPGCASAPPAGSAAASPSSRVCSGSSTITLSGWTTDLGITYQWYSSTDNTVFNIIPGATATTYATGVLTQTTYYYCISTCANTSQQSISTTATVTINPTPPSGTATANAGNITCSGVRVISLTGYSSDPGITYQWYSSTDNVSFAPILNATGLTYTSGTLTQNTYFYCVSTCTGSTLTATSTTASVVIDGTPPAGTAVASINPITCTGTTVLSLTGFSTDQGITYQWYSSSDNLTFAPITGATVTSYTTPVLSAVTYFYCISTCTLSGLTATSSTVTVNVNAVGPAAPVASAATAAGFTSFTANWAATTGATSYFLDVSTNSGFTTLLPSYNNLNVGNVLTRSVTGLTSATTYYYRVRASNACGTSVSSGNITATTLTMSWCTPSGGSSDGISGVVFGTISNTGTGLNSYTNYSASYTATVQAGNAYSLSVYVNTGGSYTNYQSVWIDFDQNGVFNTYEYFALGSAVNQTNGISSSCPYNITVPVGAAIGNTRMRVCSKYSSVNTDPCATGIDGEYEDYGIVIIAPPPPPQIPQVPVVSNSGPIFTGNTANLTAAGLAPGKMVANFPAASSAVTSGAQITAVTNTFTMEFWAYPTATRTVTAQANTGATGTSGQRYAIYPAQSGPTGGGAGVSVGTNGISVFEHGDGYLPSLLVYTGTITGWTHIAVVYTNKTPRLYVNGSLVGTGATSTKTVYASVGTGGTYGYYEGQLDNIRIWNTARSASDILNNMFLETPSNTSGLVDFYTFNGSNANAESGYSPDLSTTAVTFPSSTCYTYTWTGNGAPAASTNETQTTSVLTTTTNYTVVASHTGFLASAASATNTVTVLQLTPCTAEPVAGNISASPSNILCPHTSVISLTGYTLDVGITFQWFSSTDNITFDTIVGATAATYTTPVLSATHYYHCIVTCTNSGLSTTSATATVTYNPAALTITPSSASVCGGVGVTITASGSSNYSWSPATGLSATNIANPVATPAVNTTYTVTESGSGCSLSSTILVRVGNAPTVTASVSPTSVCVGGQVNLTSTASNISSGTLFTETFEGYSNNTQLPSNGWASYTVTDGWNYWGFSSTGVITGTRSLTICNAYSGTVWNDYDKVNYSNDRVAYYATKINATSWNNLKLNFKWKCYGEGTYDYGSVVWSTNGTTWNDWNGTKYNGQSSVQTVTNLAPSTSLDGTQFYLGFKFKNDASGGTNPPFTVDDITITGTTGYVGTYTYNWSSTPAAFSSTSQNPTANPLVPSTYTVAVTETNSGCVGTQTTGQVSMIIPSQTSAITGNAIPCINAIGTYSVTNVAGLTYTWAVPPGYAIISGQGSNTVQIQVDASVGEISVTPHDQCNNTGPATTLTLSPAGLAPLVSVSSASPVSCGGSGVQLTASGNSDAYTWTPTTGLSNPNIANPVASVFVNTTYTVTGTLLGCYATATVQINAAPSVPLLAYASPSSVCSGTPTTLSAISTSVPVNDFSLGISPWTTTNTSTSGTPAHAAWTIEPYNYNYAPPTIFGIGTTYVMNFGAGAGNYIMSNQMDQADCAICFINDVTKTTMVSPSFSTVGLTSLNLTFKHIMIQGDATYSATNNEGHIEVSTNGTTWTQLQAYIGPIGTYTSSGAIVVTNTYTPVSANINLSAYVGNPSVQVRFRYDTQGTTALWAIDDIAVNGAPVPTITYEWTANPVGFTANTAITTDSPINNTVYTVVATSNTGCTATANVPVTIFTNATTPGAITGPTAVCSGSFYNYSIAPVAFATSYTWTVPSDWVLTAGDGTPNITVWAGSTAGNVEVTQTNGCFTSLPSIHAVTATTTPTVTIDPVSATICEGFSTQLTANSTATSFAWTPAYGLSAANIHNPIAAPLTTTTYSVIGTLNACPSAAVTVTVAVNPSPTAVTVSASNNTICAGTPVDLFATSADVTYINANGNGGFEGAADFAGNGWTTVNAASNIWILGTQAPAYAGARSAYVSSTGAAYDYALGTTRTSHFYRDVVIPTGASNINLSFYWKGNGESGYDRLIVYTAPTSVTPVVNVPASTSTALTGATQVWIQPSFAQTTYALATVTLPNALAGTTVRLIFTWQNDASLGTSPGAAVDNISLISTAGAGINYAWTSIPAGFTSSVQNPIGVIPAVNTQYVVTSSIGNCYATNNTTVNVTNTNPPTGAASQSFCNAGIVADLVANGTVIKWYDAATGGNLLSPSLSLVNGQTYYASETIGICESQTRLAVSVTLGSSPAPTGNAVQVFLNVASVVDLVATGSNILWYDAATGGNLLNSADLLVDGNTYYASQTINACESQTRFGVTVTVILIKNVTLHLFLEGLFNPATLMMNEAQDGNLGQPNYGPGIADRIQVELFAENAPYAPIGVSISGIDLSTSGQATFQISPTWSGNYYIRVITRNHIEVWSAVAVPFSPQNVDYNFTTGMLQAYGSDAQVQVSFAPDLFAFYLGDLDQGGWVGSEDFNLFEPELTDGVTGFSNSDFDGGGWVGSEDFNLFEPRITAGNFAQYPAKK